MHLGTSKSICWKMWSHHWEAAEENASDGRSLNYQCYAEATLEGIIRAGEV